MRRPLAILWLSGLIALLAVLAAGVGVFWQGSGETFGFTSLRGQHVVIYGQGLYRYDPLLIGAGFRGVDLVTLVVAVPLLLVSLLMYARGSLRGGVLLFGTLGYFLYNYASMALGAAYNDLFLVYVALFSASLFAFVLVFRSLHAHAIDIALAARMPRRAIATYLFAVGALLSAVWLSDIAGAIGRAEAPTVLASNTTIVTYVLDLGVIVPLAFVAGVLLWRRAPMGYLLALMMLALNLTLGTALMAQGAAILLAGVSMTPAEISALIVSFAALTIVGLWLLALALRPPAAARLARPAPARARRPLVPVALAGVLGVIFAAFFLFVRPWYATWGATALEQQRALPGDEIIAVAGSQATRAITIHAPIDQVWPWLAQIGQDRGGFYSFDQIENLVGCRMPTTDILRPNKQSWQIGDKLWMYPPDAAGGVGFATLRTFIPGRALGFATHAPGTSIDAPEDGSWSFVLEPIDADTTRFLIRDRLTAHRPVAGAMFDRAIFEPMHFAMERRMLLGLAAVAEGRDRGRGLNAAHLALWTLAFVAFVIALVVALRRSAGVGAVAVVGATAVTFAVLTLGQPPIGVSAPLVLLACAMLLRGRRRTPAASQLSPARL